MLEIKVYNPKMQQEIECFYKRCFADLAWQYDPYGRHSDIVNIQESYMSTGCMWCMYDDNQLIGTVAVRTIDMENRIAEIRRLYVLKEYHGKGYGNMLFETALNYANLNGFNKIRADAKHDRTASQHLLRKHGFYEIPQYNETQVAKLFFELKLMA